MFIERQMEGEGKAVGVKSCTCLWCYASNLSDIENRNGEGWKGGKENTKRKIKF